MKLIKDSNVVLQSLHEAVCFGFLILKQFIVIFFQHRQDLNILTLK